MLTDWPRVHGAPLFHAELRQSPDDFIVDELLGFEAHGAGEHDLLKIRKTNTNTQWLQRQLARHAAVPPADVGYCGLKDRRAVTTQYFSVRRPDRSGTDWDAFELEGVTILDIERHDRKLRPGSHRANQFELRLRAEHIPDAIHIDTRLATIGQFGVPNYFGEQRFGHDGGNLDLARSLFSGKRLKREKRSIAISAARAFLFNEILGHRVQSESWDSILAGERANLDGSGSVFLVDAIDDELRERCHQHDIHPTASLWGDGAPASAGELARLELGVVSRYADLVEGLQGIRMKVSSRATRLDPKSLNWQRESDHLGISFELPPGAFATAVLRELATSFVAQN